jgi:hypothetical protein
MGVNLARTKKKKRKTSARAPTHNGNYDVMDGEFEELHVLEDNCSVGARSYCSIIKQASLCNGRAGVLTLTVYMYPVFFECHWWLLWLLVFHSRRTDTPIHESPIPKHQVSESNQLFSLSVYPSFAPSTSGPLSISLMDPFLSLSPYPLKVSLPPDFV